MKRMIISSSIETRKDPDLEYVGNVDGYQIYRKIVDGRGKWFAHYQDDPIETMFPITYDQARGFEDMPARSSTEKLSRDLGKMLLPVRSSSASDYTDYIDIQHGRQKFGVHINTDGPYEGAFAASISEIHPYDDAEYTWAKIGFNGQVIFYRDGKVVDKMQLAGYEPDDYEEQEYSTSAVDQYINDCLDTVATELLQMNRDVKPIMVHN